MPQDSGDSTGKTAEDNGVEEVGPVPKDEPKSDDGSQPYDGGDK